MIWSPLLNTSGVSNKLFHVSDWLPTLLSSAEIPFAKSDFDGVDQWSNLKNNQETGVRTQLLINIDPVDEWSGIIKDNFKLVSKAVRNNFDDWLNVANVETNLTDQTYVQLVMQSDTYRAIGRALTKTEILEKIHESVVECATPPTSDHPQFCGDTKNRCLFNIIEDPCEFYDLSEAHPEIVESLSKLLQEYENVMVPPLNQPSDPRSDPIHHNRTWVPWMDSNASTVQTFKASTRIFFSKLINLSTLYVKSIVDTSRN